jgi:hypothetical protein
MGAMRQQDASQPQVTTRTHAPHADTLTQYLAGPAPPPGYNGGDAGNGAWGGGMVSNMNVRSVGVAMWR